MRKNTIRKIVHGILDLLPLFVIPTFMIYARNENSSFGYQVEVTESKLVDFNQLCNFNNSDYSSSIVSSYELNLNGAYNFVNISNYVSLDSTHTYYFKTTHELVDISNAFIYIPAFNGTNNFGLSNASTSSWYYPNGCVNFRIRVTTYGTYVFDNYSFKFNIYDLTQMFGAGNEPTKTEFEALFGQYYSFDSGSQYLIENYQTVTYNDSDVGSQMFYTLYNTVDKYFNMDNIFGMHDIYSWFELNIFGGTAPLSIYVVWNIVLYEFVMDLLMLLYALFMFFIDCCKALLEKPLNSVK